MVYSHRCTCSCTARGDCAKYQLRASLQDGSVRKGERKRRSLLLKLFGTVASSLTGKITGNIRGYLCLLCKVLLFFFYTAAVCNEDHFITCTHHVLHTVHTGGVHDLNLVGILRRDPMFLSLVIQQLDLSRV